MEKDERMNTDASCVHSTSVAAGQSAELLHLSRESAGWDWMSFYVRRIVTGDAWESRNEWEERAIVLLGGHAHLDWAGGSQRIGERCNVFDGLPYVVYLPAGERALFAADTDCELAICSVPSTATLEPRLITPKDVSVSLRGGGNASRQIIDIMRPEFPAD